MNLPLALGTLTFFAVEYFYYQTQHNLEVGLPVAVGGGVAVWLLSTVGAHVWSGRIDNPSAQTYELPHEVAWRGVIKAIDSTYIEGKRWRTTYKDPTETSTMGEIHAEYRIKRQEPAFNSDKPNPVEQTAILKSYLTDELDGHTTVQLQFEVVSPPFSSRSECTVVIQTLEAAIDTELTARETDHCS